MRFGRYIFTMLMSLMVVLGASAQSTFAPRLFIENNNLFIQLDEFSAIQVTQIEPQFGTVVDAQWNNDGTKVVYIAYNYVEQFVSTLNVYDIQSNTSFVLANNPEAGFNVNITSNDEALFALISAPGSDPTTYELSFFTSALTEGTPLNQVGVVKYGVGCGGGSPFPADSVYSSETKGFAGFTLLLEQTPSGIVYSNNCGGIGADLLNPDGTVTSLNSAISRVKISPDRTRIAGISYIDGVKQQAVTVVDIATGESTDYALDVDVDQLTWIADSSIAYSSITQNGQLVEGDDLTAANIAMGFDPSFGLMEFPKFAVTVSRLSLTDGASTPLYSGDGYAVGRMQTVGDLLYVSVVSNMEDYVAGLLDGTYSVNNPLFTDPIEVVTVPVFAVNLTDNSVTQVSENLTGLTFFN
jgi:hypothetical protein